MKAIKHLLAVSILAAAGSASAVAVHTTNLTGGERAPSFIGDPYATADGTFGTYAYVSAGADGLADAVGGVFNGTVNFTTFLNSWISTDIGYEWVIDVGGHVATQKITSCNDLGAAKQCGYNYIVGATKNFNLDTYDFADPAHRTWTVSLTEYVLQLDDNVTKSFSWSGSTVPVPAAAWLFGSGLLGLAGAAKRRRAI